MIATIISIHRKLSQYKGYYFLIIFKGEDGRSYKTYIYPRLRNFKRWKPLLKEGTIIANLILKEKNLIDADSVVEEVK